MFREYREAFKKLNPDNKKTILKIKYYLNSHYLNEVCYGSLLKDIVGMALESQSRGENFSDTVGIGYKDFCDGLISNSLRQSPFEKFLGAFIWIFGYVGIVVPVMYLFSLFFNFADIKSLGIMLVTPMELIYKYLLIVFSINVGWIFVKRSIYKSPRLIVAAYLCFITLIVIFSDYITMNVWMRRKIIEVNVLIWLGILAFLVLLFIVLKSVIAHYLAKKNNCA